MASYLNFFNFISLRKEYTLVERAKPFDELNDDEFRKRFRLTKATTLLLLSEVNGHSTTILPV